MKKLTLLSLMGFLIFTSCNSEKKEIQKSSKEVMAIHDVAMAKMDEMRRLIKELNEEINEEMAKDSINDQRINKYKTAIESLESSSEGMMHWMRSYKFPDGKSFEETIGYLNSQKSLIIEVDSTINRSIRIGKSLLIEP